MGTPEEKVIIVEDLFKEFGTFKAVDHITFHVDKGAIYGFLGPNGAGKSTTIRMLCGILLPTSGKGSVAGYDIYTQTEQIKSRIGYMSQRFSLYEDLTVDENINFYSGIYNVPPNQKKSRKEWVVEMTGLQGYTHLRTGTLSVGLKQRLALGCAILHEPEILFLDEPTAGVDPINRRRFWNLIYDLSNQGITVFVTTHYMDEAEYFDRIGFIYKGKLVANGTPDELKGQGIQQKVLELVCDRPDEAIFILQSLPEIQDISFLDGRLHMIVGDEQAAKQAIEKALAVKELHIQSLEQVPPTLEDVFISLTER